MASRKSPCCDTTKLSGKWIWATARAPIRYSRKRAAVYAWAEIELIRATRQIYGLYGYGLLCEHPLD